MVQSLPFGSAYLFAAVHQAGALGLAVDAAVVWLLTYAQSVFDVVNAGVMALVAFTEHSLRAPSPWIFALIVAGLGLWRVSGGFALFALLGLNLVLAMGLWDPMISTLALVLTASFLALLIGLPLGVLSARIKPVWRLLRPCLDLMQTMPAFVYLIPAVMLFSTGAVPAIIATLVFSMPPVVRLTQLGIRQVPLDLIEVGRAFGCSELQLLWKVQMPSALPTLMSGVNQTIMLALSMVVIASMIGGGGLGDVVLRGIQQLDVGLGFEGGIAVVILAVILDRLSQSLMLEGERALEARSRRWRSLWRTP
ncbi:choline ABC transporter permease [Synechococcus sp. WH 8020]|uniref:ABC transporter permease n=1 Tax=Synechococcus sp. (strain WH8020) TaxID=32052 RepID=UPI000652807B|nr:ABC transporter permease subunit [Synechococcus sp. WH 8020]AKN61855.1 choline ABC transporter permease [Synechococcus sp. WH 8020]